MPLQMKDDFVGPEKPLDVPKELWMMIDHLHRNASLQVRSPILYWTRTVISGLLGLQNVHHKVTSSFMWGQYIKELLSFQEHKE